jgi:hypothetical protein
MRNRLLDLLLITSLAIVPAFQSQGELVQAGFVLGRGRFLCEKWTSDRLISSYLYQQDIQWLYGYISGYNDFSPTVKRPFLPQDETNLASAIGEECESAPKILVAQAVRNFLDGFERPYSKPQFQAPK